MVVVKNALLQLGLIYFSVTLFKIHIYSISFDILDTKKGLNSRLYDAGKGLM